MFHEIQFFEETERVNFVPSDEFVALKWNVSIIACQFHQILRVYKPPKSNTFIKHDNV